MKKITLLLSLLISSIGFSQELVTNGDFQTGVAAPWTGNAANPVDLGGGNYFNQANVSTAGAAYAVNLWQEILLNDGTTYTLTFDAFTDTDTGSRTILAGLGQTGAPYEALTETVNLTPTSQTFTYTFTINYGDAVTDRVLFDMGADIGYVFIDNVSVQEFVDTEAPTDFTASVGTVGATSVELLLNATDNSGSVTYDVTYGATTTQATGVSGVETSVTINGLTPETAYTFSVSASDSSSNVAANNPIELPATTVEDTNTACAGTSSSAAQGSFGGSTFDYAFETLTNGDVKMTFTLNQPGLVAYAWNQSPFSETPMTVTGNVATLDLTGLSEGDVINKAVKFVWAAGGFAVTEYFTYTVGDDCVETPDEDNVTLSDLQLDGTTIDGFSGSTISYDVVVNEPGATIPVVSATAAFGTVGAITQASEIPGTATFEVTSQSTNFTQTYTVNFVFVGPQTAAPIPPAREASDVISFYSDAYSATGLTNFDAGWCGANSVTEISVEANAVMAWNTVSCQGIEFTAIDATSFTNLHFDLYIAAETDMIGKVFNLKFVETSSGAFKEVNFNSGSSPALVAGQWNSVDVVVDLSDYEALNQFAVTSNLHNLAWYDNMYLWKEPTASGTDVTLSDLTIDGTTIAGFAAGATSYTVDLVQGTTTAPSIAAVSTDSNATVDVTDATSVPGSGIVVVTSADGTTTATITVSFTANIPAVDAPAPTQLEADVVSVYSDTFSTNILTNNNPGWGQATQVTEVQLGASNNNTLKYSNLNYQGMLYDATDVSSMDYVHLDYYTNDATALEFFVIKDGTGENTYDIAGTIGITTGEWVSVDIPLAHYTVTDLTGVNQFKTVGNGTVYLDNLFFWNTPTASVEDFATNSVKMYPNPAKGVVNFSSASNVALDVAVYDMLGKQVLRANAVQSQLNISSLNPGMYFVKMTQGSSSATKKLVVK